MPKIPTQKQTFKIKTDAKEKNTNFMLVRCPLIKKKTVKVSDNKISSKN